MKKAILLLFSAVFTLIVIAQDKVINDPNAESRPVSSFHAIKVSNGIELLLKQGNTEALAVSASEKEYRDRIKTEVVDGVLKIYYDNKLFGWYTGHKKLRAYVSFKNLDKLNGSSGSETIIDGSINASKLDIRLSSGAGLKGTINAASLSVDQSSGSTSHVNGKVQNLKVETSSGADFQGYDLSSDNCEAEASSGGNIHVTVQKELDAQASSGGDIHYKGTGVITRISTSSGGSVKKNS